MGYNGNDPGGCRTGRVIHSDTPAAPGRGILEAGAASPLGTSRFHNSENNDQLILETNVIIPRIPAAKHQSTASPTHPPDG